MEAQRPHDRDTATAPPPTTLNPESYADKRRDFESQVAEVQRKVQERGRQLDQAKAAALNQVREAMIDVARELAEQRGFNLLLPSSGLVLFSPQIDLTDEILTRLDQKLPNIKVPERVD